MPDSKELVERLRTMASWPTENVPPRSQLERVAADKIEDLQARIDAPVPRLSWGGKLWPIDRLGMTELFERLEAAELVCRSIDSISKYHGSWARIDDAMEQWRIHVKD